MNQNYGLLNSTSSARIIDPYPPTPDTQAQARARARTKIRTFCLLLILGTLLIIIATTYTILTTTRNKSNGPSSGLGPTRVIRKACTHTHYPDLCLTSVANFPGSVSARSPLDVAHISMNVTLSKLGRALRSWPELKNLKMDTLTRSAYEDCMELLEDSINLIVRSLYVVSKSGSSSIHARDGGNNMIERKSKQDVMTWLSGALTNQDTCMDGFSKVGGSIKNRMVQNLEDLSEHISNCLAIYKASHEHNFDGTITKNRRLLEFEPEIDPENEGFPKWISRSERELLGTPVSSVRADIIVAQDGSGNVKTITEAIKKAPLNSTRRFIIVVKAGIYVEDNLKVGLKKTNLWFLGEGKGRTIISGNRSVGHDQVTTFHTAAFAATGAGFVVRDITFVNEAGPNNNQAVALRVGADHAVVYRCEIKGYQDTLYVHSNRQFYRECDIYGTVDFIFGNAAVVFQNCTMWARKPQVFQQKLTITAQNRKDPNQNTGMSIHACQARATMDLEATKSNYPTYLGRPWQIYARVVYMESYLGDHINPKGWLQWNTTSPVDKLYYGEYENIGPGANTSQRVQWPSLHVNMSRMEAEKFTVAQFILGQGWITATGVSYQSGLSS